jgi:uncharacterized membrane protein
MSLAEGFGEHNLEDVVNVLVQVVEAAGALIIFVGAVIAFVRFARAAIRPASLDPFARLRLNLGRYLVLGLEFQLAADILRTAVAPNFSELAQLAAIAAIRTALNFFLGREIKEETELVRADQAGSAVAAASVATSPPAAGGPTGTSKPPGPAGRPPSAGQEP